MPARGTPASDGTRCSRPFSSVPRQLPAAGCTTRPGRLSITISVSSSNTTSSGTSSATKAVSSSLDCGSTRTSSPGQTGSRADAGRAPIVTWPSPIQRWMRARE